MIYIKQNNFRTYQRRGVTRESGYHTIEGSTGGECLVKRAQSLQITRKKTIFRFYRKDMVLIDLFDSGNGILSFGGYIHTDSPIRISFSLIYTLGKRKFAFERDFVGPIDTDDWNNIGFHKEISLDEGNLVNEATLDMIIECDDSASLEFISFDFGPITKAEFVGDTLAKSFRQKTSMHIPYLYYLDTVEPMEKYMPDPPHFGTGRLVVLKSCNRCGRYLPINIENEMSTLSFSLHCVKRAPCVHSTFRAYTIQNMNELTADDLIQLPVEGNKIATYYGHQLECKACKKFFVNAPLNPQRNPQQFKEDGLRRRALEILVNTLLERNLIHFEFKYRTKKEFSEYIWRKFNCRCFKCGRRLPLDEMHLDHTMPLAYLYRLDESATCLCGTHNSQKRDRFPVDFYDEDELRRLSKITGLSIEQLTYKGVNHEVLRLLVDNVVWFYDEFLMQPEYQKVRDGIRTSDKINDSLKRVIGDEVDLATEYRKITGRYPKSVTIVR